MSNTVISPNMNLPVPVVGLDPGPDYATNVNSSLGLIDAHNHTSGNGVQITPNGLNINTDLPLNGNNLTLTRTVRFNAQNGPITASPPDLNCIYVAGVDFYLNDGSGNQIRLTQSGNVAGSSGTITGLPSGTASASYQTASGTFVFQQATSTAANIDAATLIVRYPGSYPTPAGNYIALEAPSSLSTGYSLTLPTLPAQSDNFLTITTSGVINSSIKPDGVFVVNSGGIITIGSGSLTANQVSASANIRGDQLAPAANILGSQLSASANILGSQLSASANILGAQLATNVTFPGKSVQVSGQDIVVGSTNGTNGVQIASARVIGSTGNVVANSGSGGFTCTRAGAGQYTITWSPVFLSGTTPSCTISYIDVGGAALVAFFTSNPTATGVTINIRATDGTLGDADFMLTAIGQRP